MPSQPSEPNSPAASSDLDLDLPVPEVPLPDYHPLSLDEAMRAQEEIWRHTTYDAAYFAESLARKNDVPFEM